MKHRSIVGSLLTLGISAALTVGSSVLPATADEVTVSEQRWVVSPQDAIIQPGESVTYQLTLVDENNQPIEPNPEEPVYLGTDAGGDIVEGTTVTAFSSGPRAVMVRSLDNGVEYFGATSLTVVGDPVSLEITPSATTVNQGGTLTFEVTGVDEWGTPIDGSSATLSSSVAGDVIDGLSVNFPTASPHTITAQLAGVTASVTVEVVPAASAADSGGPSGAPALAETGVNPSVGWIAVGLLLLVGMASLLIFRRRGATS